ncbi:exodeoxyribonuclease VII large subunit [Sediminibacillus dalangtanensis]|uniref:Exodeoxyribonuclease 7 large subunit n=1 Tax=Sediminibacillus dalangtanensis TaxID=2729421 RepID=A0ABX7VW13_9BACI|nr:exodeoxyribonuclease VII large subunit [Sediminibacillus dalangtanensis]QTM99785.1 exodeoxyribonuclease VII large subunit [Sediminibacillus dalangtanensis]
MNDRYLTVTALTKYIKRKFEMDRHLKDVWLKAEISNFKHHSRGHMYLTLKDDHSRIQAVMFAGNNRSLKFKPENGMNVLVKGELSVYEPQGQYQLYISQMEPDGIGALYLAFEQLKEKLSKEGLFDHSVKQSIPVYPKKIGVITSPTGAAVRDIMTTLSRRYPIAKSVLFPVLVQGSQSAASIVKAIETASRMGDFDVLIVGRGGGSIEELWSFNEEIVARAIHASTVPVISAIGHETDFTISDMVADMRAATPTAAAELAVPSQAEIKERIIALDRSMDRALKSRLASAKERLGQLQRAYAFRYPAQLLRQKEQELDKFVERLGRGLSARHNSKQDSLRALHKRLMLKHPKTQTQLMGRELNQLRLRLDRAFAKEVQARQNRFQKNLDKLSLLNPLNTMKRGYSITYQQNGEVLSSTKKVQPGEQVTVKLFDGSLDCQVWGIEEEKQ